MKVIVAGSRSIEDKDLVEHVIRDAPFQVSELVSGGAEGVDQAAESLVEEKSIKRFDPDWKEHGKAAGPIRNKEMADYADALIAIWDGESAGTKDMIEKALDANLDIYVRQVD